MMILIKFLFLCLAGWLLFSLLMTIVIFAYRTIESCTPVTEQLSPSYEPNVEVKAKPRSRRLDTVPVSQPVNSAIKEFTLPDGSKIAVDCGKVDIEEKKVIE